MKQIEHGISISFKYAPDGLVLKGTQVNALSIYMDGTEISKDAYTCVLVDQTLQILFQSDLDERNHHFRVDFAKTPYYEVNLYNQADIPAKPFSLEI